jgi:alkylhydroperoxidase/carboxymuconolactone decarboxylase family protein YurZ
VRRRLTAKGTLMTEETPVLSALADITAVSIERGTLDAREHMLARITALVAVGAPPASYLLNVGTAADIGITLEDIQGLLIAVAPIVGTPQIVAATASIAEALGFALDLAAAEAEAEAEEG